MRVVIFASRAKSGGGSNLEYLIKACSNNLVNVEIVGIISDDGNGSVHDLAFKYNIPFVHFRSPWSAEMYQVITSRFHADFFVLLEWDKLVVGLDPSTRFNSRTVFGIHSGPRPEFGGKGMYGHHVHEAVLQAGLDHTAVTMYFVVEGYSGGPIFLNCKVPIEPGDTSKTLGERVGRVKRGLHYRIMDMVVNGRIKWDGINPKSLVVPDNYYIERIADELLLNPEA